MSNLQVACAVSLSQGHVGHGRWVLGVSGTCWAWQRGGIGGLRNMLNMAEGCWGSQGHVGHGRGVGLGGLRNLLNMAEGCWGSQGHVEHSTTAN